MKFVLTIKVEGQRNPWAIILEGACCLGEWWRFKDYGHSILVPKTEGILLL